MNIKIKVGILYEKTLVSKIDFRYRFMVHTQKTSFSKNVRRDFLMILRVVCIKLKLKGRVLYGFQRPDKSSLQCFTVSSAG